MSTPTPMKHAPSQQGKTPSQSQHGATTSPPVSTPFSAVAAHASFSPHGHRSSPQQVKKSPATSTITGHHINSSMNFDSPSAAAAFGVLGMGSSLDIGLDNVDVGALGSLGPMGKINDNERARRLEHVIEILDQNKGLVSEAGLERFAKRLGLECLWEDDMGSEPKSRTLIVAGSTLELLIVLSNNVVQSVSLAFPDSPEIVTKHAEKAGKILLDGLKLLPGQSPLTKRLDRFAAEFEHLATLDKLSINPGLNLYEAVAGIYESLERLYQFDLGRVRGDPAVANKNDTFLSNLVRCTRHGMPIMHARNRVGLSLDYWREEWRIPVDSEQLAAYVAKVERTWSLLIGCAPMGGMAIAPVRISTNWISPNVEKPSLGDGLQLGPPAALDWLEPDNTILQSQGGPAKPEAGTHSLEGDNSNDNNDNNNNINMGPKLPEVVFVATLDPPLNVPLLVWQQIRQLGGDLGQTDLVYTTLDSLMFPIPPGSQHDPSELRTVSCTKKVRVKPPDGGEYVERTHKNKLYIYKPVYGKALKDIPFSHIQQLVAMLPTLRQYALLSTILDNSFCREPDVSARSKSSELPGDAGGAERDTGNTITTNQDDFNEFMAAGPEKPAGKEASDGGGAGPQPLPVDVTLTAHPVPRLQIVFPFRSATANVVLEIRPNGEVHVESQNVIDDSNAVAPNGRQRRPEDVGKLLEMIEDIGKWCEFIRTRWQ